MWWLVALGALLLMSHVAPFPLALDAAAPGRVMWRAPAHPTAPTIYLTFDDGPNPAATPALLDVLARERVRATFFVIDTFVTDETRPILQRMAAEGHGVGIHSDARWLMTRSSASIARWLDAAAQRIGQAAGARPCRAFRPHAGWRSVSMLRAVAEADYQLVGWGWNAWDWNWFRPRTADAIVRRVTARASDGLIVVIHDGHHENPRADRRYAVEAAARVIPALRARGFEFGTICDAIAREREGVQPAAASGR